MPKCFSEFIFLHHYCCGCPCFNSTSKCIWIRKMMKKNKKNDGLCNKICLSLWHHNEHMYRLLVWSPKRQTNRKKKFWKTECNNLKIKSLLFCQLDGWNMRHLFGQRPWRGRWPMIPHRAIFSSFRTTSPPSPGPHNRPPDPKTSLSDPKLWLSDPKSVLSDLKSRLSRPEIRRLRPQNRHIRP